MKSNIFVPLAVCMSALFSVSCGDKAKISGRLAGSDTCTVILEETTANGPIDIDTVQTDRKGNFKFSVNLPATGTTFYKIKVNGSTGIPLFISPGENIRSETAYGNPSKYSIEGSRESALVKELNDIMNDGAMRLDSLSRLISTADREEAHKTYIREYAMEYSHLKREQIKFIIRNSGTLAALYGLQQRLPNDKTLFNGASDIVYYRLVADSVSKYYPGSPYLASLKSYVDMSDANEELTSMLRESLCNPAPFPDIALPDMYGHTCKLSSLNGKVILLVFWHASDPASAIYNAELKELCEQFAPEGFEIYQVGLDTSEPTWVNAVQTQKLPWISVCDFQGTAGIAPRVYNISQAPANYLINGEGEIVARNVPVEKLHKEIKRLVAELK